jgi:hypothetical protein
LRLGSSGDGLTFSFEVTYLLGKMVEGIKSQKNKEIGFLKEGSEKAIIK